jgi:hypothetical protein
MINEAELRHALGHYTADGSECHREIEQIIRSAGVLPPNEARRLIDAIWKIVARRLAGTIPRDTVLDVVLRLSE